jgi:hypothetical protein
MRIILPGLPSPESASAAKRTSGSSIETMLLVLLPLPSSLRKLPASDGLVIAMSRLLRVPFTYPALWPISIGGRLLFDIGEHLDANAASADACALASNSGDSTVRRSGRVMSQACLWLVKSCWGTCGNASSVGSWLVCWWVGERERCCRSSMCGYDAVSGRVPRQNFRIAADRGLMASGWSDGTWIWSVVVSGAVFEMKGGSRLWSWCAARDDYLTVRSRAFEALCHMLRLALRRLAKHTSAAACDWPSSHPATAIRHVKLDLFWFAAAAAMCSSTHFSILLPRLGRVCDACATFRLVCALTTSPTRATS